MEQFQEINIQEIQRNPYQPRTNFDSQKLQELADSIKENGLIQPIIVRKSAIYGYELLAGERRFRAAKIAGLQSLPALVKNLTDKEMREQAIIENLQREDLNPIEEALSYKSLVDNGFTHDEIAKTMGKSRPYISNLLRLLQLSEPIIQAVKTEEISQAHARLLIKFSEKEQKEWLQKIIQEDISVRKLEKLVQEKKEQQKEKKKNLFITEQESYLQKLLGTKVHIQMKSNQEGSLQIHFSSPEEYQRIINSLK